MTAKLEFVGARRVARGLKITREGFAERCAGPATKAVAERAWRRAKSTASFVDRTGELRKSIRVEQGRELAPRTGRFVTGWQIAAGGRRAFYATFIERGTRFIRARNFLRDAVFGVSPLATRIMAPIIRARYAPLVREAKIEARGIG